MEADARADNGADARADRRNMLQQSLNRQRSLNKRVASQPPDVGPLVSPRATPRILAPVGLSCQYVPLSSVASGSVDGGGDELTKLLNAEVAAIGSAGDARAASARAQARPPHLEGAQFGTCAGPGQVLAPQVSAPAQSAPPREAETVATTNLSSPEVSAPQVSTQAQAWLNGPRETALDGTGFDLGPSSFSTTYTCRTCHAQITSCAAEDAQDRASCVKMRGWAKPRNPKGSHQDRYNCGACHYQPQAMRFRDIPAACKKAGHVDIVRRPSVWSAEVVEVFRTSLDAAIIELLDLRLMIECWLHAKPIRWEFDGINIRNVSKIDHFRPARDHTNVEWGQVLENCPMTSRRLGLDNATSEATWMECLLGVVTAMLSGGRYLPSDNKFMVCHKGDWMTDEHAPGMTPIKAICMRIRDALQKANIFMPISDGDPNLTYALAVGIVQPIPHGPPLRSDLPQQPNPVAQARGTPDMRLLNQRRADIADIQVLRNFGDGHNQLVWASPPPSRPPPSPPPPPPSPPPGPGSRPVIPPWRRSPALVADDGLVLDGSLQDLLLQGDMRGMRCRCLDCCFGDSPRQLTPNSSDLDHFVYETHRNWVAVQRHMKEQARGVRAVAANVERTITMGGPNDSDSDSDGRSDRTDNAPGPKNWFLECPGADQIPAPPADQIPATTLGDNNKEVVGKTEDDKEVLAGMD